MEKEVKMTVEPSPLKYLADLMSSIDDEWNQVRPPDYPPKVEERLRRGYKLDMPGT